jgi:hypothetical protein
MSSDHPTQIAERRYFYSAIWCGVRDHGERIIYRASGVGLNIAAAIGVDDCAASTAIIRDSYLDQYWQPERASEWVDILIAFAIWPLAVLVAALWMTWRNGAIVAQRAAKGRLRQFVEQLSLAIRRGILPPWYYVFELHDRDRRHLAGDMLCRAETKDGAYRLLARARQSRSPLNNKVDFADYCRDRGLETAPVLAVARHGLMTRDPPAPLPESDLFLKPVRANGGNGAERWDRIGPDRYRNAAGRQLSREGLLAHLLERSRLRKVLLQPRLSNHHTLADLSNDALATLRILTCLDEHEQPETVGAVLRMAIGDNHTVDNIHAGGIAAPVDLDSGELGLATDLGTDSRRGRIARHPDSLAMILGRQVTGWAQARQLAERAHRAFADHVLIGWDVAILAEGPCLIEGNSGPDLDLMQRVIGRPMGNGRLGSLLALRLLKDTAFRPRPRQRRVRARGPSAAISAIGGNPAARSATAPAQGRKPAGKSG